MAKKKIYKHHGRSTTALAEADAQDRELVVASGSGVLSIPYGGTNYRVPANRTYDVKAYGAVGSGSGNDATAINDTIDAATVSGGIVDLPPGNYRITAPIVFKSNIHFRGAGKNLTTITYTSGTGSYNISTLASSVSGVKISGCKFVGLSGATDVATAMLIAGSDVTVEECEFDDTKRSITVLSTASEVRIWRNRCTWSTANFVGEWAVCFNGATNCEAIGNTIIGTDVSLGVNRGVSLKNGGKLRGAQYITVTGNRVINARNPGIGGDPDAVLIDGSTVDYRTIEFSKTASYTNAAAGDLNQAVTGTTRTLTMAPGFTGPQATDIGKEVVDGTSGATGTLRAYDPTGQNWYVNVTSGTFGNTNTVTIPTGSAATGAIQSQTAPGVGILVEYDNSEKLWLISMTSGAFTAADVISAAVTGTGTQNANFSPAFGICGSSSVITGNIISGGIDSQLGSGVAVDGLWECSVFGNVLVENGSRGAFVGDGPNKGSVVAANVCARNTLSGIDASRSRDTVLLGNACRRNGGSGIRSEPAVTGGCDSTTIIGNACLENGVSGSDSLDSGIGGTFSASAIVGNLLGRNVWSGLYLVNGSKNVVAANGAIDNNYANAVASVFGLYLDGTSTRNLVMGNLSARYEDASIRQRAGVNLSTNADNNVVSGNMVEPNLPAYPGVLDSAAGTTYLNNVGDVAQYTDLTIANAGTLDLPDLIGELLVYNVTSNCFGVYNMSGSGGASVTEVSDPTDNFHTTAGTATSTNVYHTGSVYRLQNNTGGERTYRLFFVGRRG